jgi:hypothetical protein
VKEATMGIGDILWLFIMVSALQPIIQQRLLDASRLRLLHKMERDFGSRMITLVHR